MSLTRDPVVDGNIESHQEDLAPIGVSYTKYEYEKVSAQSGNVQNWLGGQNVTFKLGEYSDAVYDLSESYIEMKVRLQVRYSYTTDPGDLVGNPPTGPHDVPLSGYSTAAVEKFFMSGLFEDISVSYGGTPVEQLESDNQLFPLLHSVYTMASSTSSERYGSALVNNWAYPSTLIDDNTPDDASIQIRDGAANGVPRTWSTVRDAEWPYNECLAADDERQPSGFTVTSPLFVQQVGLGANPNQGGVYNPVEYPPGFQYRQSLILGQENVTAPSAAGPANDSFQDTTTNVLMKLKLPFCDEKHKKPANIPISFIFRRARDLRYAIQGDSLHDAVVSSGNDLPEPSAVTSSTYTLKIDDMSLYIRKLTLSENQKMVLFESPSMIYDMPSWRAEQFDLTSQTFTKTVTAPDAQVVLVGMVPKNNISLPALGSHFNKKHSVYHTTPREVQSFSFLQLNTSFGRIPEQPYEAASDNSLTYNAQDLRAYKEFLKSLKAENNSPVCYRDWVSHHNWYAFILDTSDENVYTQSNRRDASTFTVNARTVGESGEVVNQAIVVITMKRNELVLRGLRNVALIV